MLPLAICDFHVSLLQSRETGPAIHYSSTSPLASAKTRSCEQKHASNRVSPLRTREVLQQECAAAREPECGSITYTDLSPFLFSDTCRIDCAAMYCTHKHLLAFVSWESGTPELPTSFLLSWQWKAACLPRDSHAITCWCFSTVGRGGYRTSFSYDNMGRSDEG